MRKPAFFAYAKTKTQISLSVTAKVQADQPFFLLHVKYNPSSFKIRNFKPLATLCGCTARFVSDLVGNPEDRISHNEAQLRFDAF